MNDKLHRLPCRLAIRSEGEYINCYFAEDDTMDDALLLGSIKRSIVETDERLFDEWREFMQRAFGLVAVRAIGVEPVWSEPEKAPEHERSGRA